MKLFLITGSSSGIGKALCEYLLEDAHHHVIGIARTNDISESNFEFKRLDLKNLEAVKGFSMIDAKKYDQITFINNAGMLGDIMPLGKIGQDSIEQVMAVNLTSVMLLSNAFISAYQDAEAVKTIINISSGASSSPYASWASYCASKAGLEMFSKCVELEQQSHPYPIHCFSIAPGVVDTSMQKHIRNADIQNFAMKPKFEELYQNNQLYAPELVARHIADIALNPEKYPEKVFRIQV